MDPLHVHLLLNHVPVIGTIGALLLLAWGLLRRSKDVTMAALTGIILVALVTIPVYITGQNAEERVQGPRVAHHKDAAIAATIGIACTAAVALSAMFVFFSTRRFPMFSALAALLLGIAATVLVVRAASLGGEIRHDELTEVTVAPVTADP